MNDEFWKDYPPIPGFSCLEMKEIIQEQITRETSHTTRQERLKYYQRGAQQLRAELLHKHDHSIGAEDPASPYWYRGKAPQQVIRKSLSKS